MNDEKTNFINFCKHSNKTEVQNEKLTLNNETIECSENVKYLGVLIDQCLMYELEIKKVLAQMATSIQSLYTLCSSLNKKTRLLVFKTLIMSNFQYPAILLGGVQKKFITSVEKQLSWAVKVCFYRSKFQRSSDLKLKHSIFTVRNFLDINLIN